MKGTTVKLHTGNGDEWVPAIVTSDPDAEDKVWVTAFPGPAKDSESLGSATAEILAAPGVGKYEFQPLQAAASHVTHEHHEHHDHKHDD